MKDLEKRSIIDDVAKRNGCGCIILENESYPTGLSGYTFDENGKMRCVYKTSLMIKDLMENNNWSEEEAWEWYDCNTERGLPYCYTKDAPCPIIINDLEEEEN